MTRHGPRQRRRATRLPPLALRRSLRLTRTQRRTQRRTLTRWVPTAQVLTTNLWSAELSKLTVGHAITVPEVLFKKIDDDQIAEWTARFGGAD